MNNNNLDEVALSAPLFERMKGEDINVILERSKPKKLAAGQIIAREYDAQTHLCLIKKGSIKVFKVTPAGYEVLLTNLLPGNAFGLGTVLPGDESYFVNGQAIGETLLYTWDKAKVRQLIKQFPTLIENAILITLQRFQQYSDKYLAFVSAEKRLSQELLQIGARTGKQIERGLEVRASDRSLASQAHVDRDTAGFLFAEWEKIGALEKGKRTLVIRSPETMIRFLLG